MSVSTLRLVTTQRSQLIAPSGASVLRLIAGVRARPLLARAGVPGAPGGGAEPDVSDLTLIFENRLL